MVPFRTHTLQWNRTWHFLDTFCGSGLGHSNLSYGLGRAYRHHLLYQRPDLGRQRLPPKRGQEAAMTLISVKVKPRATQLRIQQKSDREWVVSLPSPPVDGKANSELIQLLAKTLDIPKSAIRIKSGRHSRHKLIEIDDGF